MFDKVLVATWFGIFLICINDLKTYLAMIYLEVKTSLPCFFNPQIDSSFSNKSYEWNFQFKGWENVSKFIVLPIFLIFLAELYTKHHL